MSLSSLAVKQADPASKPYKLSDSRGLYLLVHPSGSKYWRFKYRFSGREKVLALGVYPEVSLAKARAKRDEARDLLRDGIDPSEAKKENRRREAVRSTNSFEAVARRWIEKQGNRWSVTHAAKVLESLENNVFPYIGARPIDKIDAAELLGVLSKIEARGAHDYASRIRQRCGGVFRFGIVTRACRHNPAGDLVGALTPAKLAHYNYLSEAEMPEFLRKLEAYEGTPVTKLGLKLLVLTAVRTGELRQAEWSEFTLKGKVPIWRIPATRMKMGVEHVVPLSEQVIQVLEELQVLTGKGRLLFPSRSSNDRPMSENTLLFALYRMGYRGRCTGHGFRSTFSTILNEQGHRPDVIEAALAHAERNKIRAAYNRAQYLPERRNLMQHWADHVTQMLYGDHKIVSLYAS